MSENNTRFLQYIAGERQGEVLVFDHIEEEDDMIFLCFKDGSRCNEELALPPRDRKWEGKLMAEVASTNKDNLWTFDEKWVGRREEKYSKPEDSPDGEIHLVQPFVKGKKKTTPIPPRRTKSVFGNIDRRIETAPASAPVIEEKPKAIEDPVWLMMDKAKKKDTNVEMSVVISLPSKALYDVAKDSFDEGGEKTINYIIDKIKVDEIKEGIRKALYEAYGEQPEMGMQGEPETVEEPVISDDIPGNQEELKETE